jgi:diguanylate cyclase (GGDEF)-like protein/PAS domain S-box-containing protein
MDLSPSVTPQALSEALKRCESEAIQFSGAVQPHGGLLGVDASGRIRTVSANLSQVLNVAPNDALGRHAKDVLGESAWQTLLDAPRLAEGSPPCPWVLRLGTASAPLLRPAQIHRSQGLWVVELEAPNPDLEGLSGNASVEDLLASLLADADDLDSYARLMTAHVRSLTGFDRVMVYRFDPQWNGEVIAESRRSGVSSFLGNHFPASDIPPPARALYARNWVRILVDRDAPAAPLIDDPDRPLDAPLDLSFSVLRSMSPVHLQYLTNMGVRASLSVSLMQNGRLWGLIACHHETPRQLPLRLRHSLELVARTVATRLAALAFQESQRFHERVRDLMPRLTGLVQPHQPDEALLSANLQQEVLGLVNASGAVVVSGEQLTPIGRVPAPDDIRALMAWLLPHLAGEGLWSSHALSAHYPAAAAYTAEASGLLAVSLDDRAEHSLLWFREEVVRTLPWAGNATKHLVTDNQGPRLEPRRSFEQWLQIKRGESPPWTGPEVDAARTLSLTLAERCSRRLLQAAEASRRLAASVYENSSEAMVVSDAENRILTVNPAFSVVTGYPAETVLGRTPSFLKSDRHNEAFYARLWEDLADQQVWTGEIWIRCRNGDALPQWLTLNNILDEDGSVSRRVALFTDISERKKAEADLRVAAAAFESQEGMMVCDANGRILRVNQAFSKISGYTAEEVVGLNPRHFQSGRHEPSFYADMWARIQATGGWQGEVWDRRKNGDLYPVWLTVTAVRGADAQVTHYVGTFADMTERKAAAEQIEHLAFYDHLTELPNRRLMHDRLERALINANRRQRPGAVMMIDLDNFKTLNDTLGHAVGDLLLVAAAGRLLQQVRSGDTVARLGGDEFVVILEDLEPGDAALSQARTVAEKLRDSLGAPYLLRLDPASNGQQATDADGSVDPPVWRHVCSSSIGIAVFSDHAVSADELVKRADTAMYQAKAAGRNTLRFFDPTMQSSVKARAALEADLRQALDRQELVLFYQPQVNERGQVVGAEALVRWQHPVRGLVPPADFIALAEDTGLIVPLGLWVLQSACHQLGQWQGRAETRHLSVAVNVSAKQFGAPHFSATVRHALAQSNAPAHRLKLELTESLLLENAADTVAKMRELQAEGVCFTLDDFGTGYSSLSYLKHLPLAQIKLDQSFVRDLTTDATDRAIAKTVLTLGESLGMAVVAEGVETEAQHLALMALGCRLYQGYHFGRPVPLASFETALTRAENDNGAMRHLPD